MLIIYDFYLELATGIIEKSEASLEGLTNISDTNLLKVITEIKKFIIHAKRQKEQITLRILKG